MLYTPFIRTVALWLVVVGIGCGGGATDIGPVGNTEVNLVISDPATASDQILPLIDFVSYRITCLDNPELTQYDDSVDLNGNFGVDATAPTPVWQLVTDLPLAPCTISMWVFYEDEVVCSGTEALEIVEDSSPLAPNKVNIVLECNLSVNGPSGDVGIDGTYEFIHGNYCPKLTWLGAVPTVLPLETNIETNSFDPDSTCGLNCDQQTCDFTQNPPLCTPGPEAGLSNTLTAPAGKGSFGTASLIDNPNMLQTTYTCNPLFPGPTEICVVASDGDNDCDQIRCTTIVCPDLCEGVVCDDGNECTRDVCDPLNGLCTNDDAPDGIACDNCNSTCQAGACDAGTPYVASVSSSIMNFQGSFQPLNTTIVNPYSGDSVALSGQFYVNSASYKGVGASDILLGSSLSDVLFVYDLVGSPPEPPQRLCSVDLILAANGFDVMSLADEYIVLGNMVIDGGTSHDVLWANAGNDTVRGLNGQDRLDGGPGDDRVEGGNGNDTIGIWPGSGFDTIIGGTGTDLVDIGAMQSQILITPAANPIYEFDITYLGTPMAQIREVELLDMIDVSIDLSTCTGPVADVCNLCGNDALNGSEGCDDGNNVDGDGCAADCTAEY